MREYAKLDTALEIMSYKLAKAVTKNNENNDEEAEKNIQTLKKIQKEVYKGNMEIIDKVIKVYGKEIKDDINNKKRGLND